MPELSPRYNPRETEEKWSSRWLKERLFDVAAEPQKEPFSIVIPPPNVTGILHMGHALNNTIQDILIRYHRMKGECSMWMPGTDHAGIATQNVVERALAKDGLKRQDVGRENFLERVWEWRHEYGSTIINQLKRLGCACDWSRTRFTMDDEYSTAVKHVFVSLWKAGLIYQGDYIINWCPRCHTALSDEEAPYHEVSGKLYYIRYPFKDGSFSIEGKNFIVVATTRPETMLGDTAVAVNPHDKRFQHLIGVKLILPLIEREIEIIGDDFVDPTFGTGLVKVTPAHDPNDYAIGMRHELEFINIMHPDGVLNDHAGAYSGMDRFEARESILEDLRERKLLEKIDDHQHTVGHCYRCHTVIEPYLSKQWFVKMKPLAKEAIQVVKSGKVKFHPERWTKVYLNWMENIRDWCISRQIWWGHRIPVWYCEDCHEVMAALETPQSCTKCDSNNLKQDEDVLDTWFSSWLWPFATFYWPSDDARTKRDLSYFYPTNVLVTAQEIIFFWVARMIMSGLYFMKDIPFRDVYIHGTVRDIEGKKMSKSLGNIIDPLEIIDEYGCDALRFSLVSLTSTGQDVFLSKEKFEKGRNFANKIWNASRFLLINLKEDAAQISVSKFKEKELTLADRWILSELHTIIKDLNSALASYRFNESVNLLYEFFWNKFCDWYIEIAKVSIEERATQAILFTVLETIIRLLQPFMPFITEELWHTLPNHTIPIAQATWPKASGFKSDKSAQKSMQLLIDLISNARNLRAVVEIPAKEKIAIQIQCSDVKLTKIVNENSSLIARLVHAETITCIKKDAERKKGINAVVTPKLTINISLEGVVDMDVQRKRFQDQIKQTEQFIKQKQSRLANENFVSKAPRAVVDGVRQSCEELEAKLAKLKEMSRVLGE